MLLHVLLLYLSCICLFNAFACACCSLLLIYAYKMFCLPCCGLLPVSACWMTLPVPCSTLLPVSSYSMLLPVPVLGYFLSFPVQCFYRSFSCLCLSIFLHAPVTGFFLSLPGRVCLFNASAGLCSRHSPIFACSMLLPHPVPVSLLSLHHLFNASTSRVHVYFLPLPFNASRGLLLSYFRLCLFNALPAPAPGFFLSLHVQCFCLSLFQSPSWRCQFTPSACPCSSHLSFSSWSMILPASVLVSFLLCLFNASVPVPVSFLSALFHVSACPCSSRLSVSACLTLLSALF